MVKPLSLSDIGSFLQMVLFAFDDYLFFAFVIMVAFSVAMGIRNLLVWGS